MFQKRYGIGIFGIIGCAMVTSLYYLSAHAGLPATEVLRVNLLYPGLFTYFVLFATMNYPGAADLITRVILITVAVYLVFLLVISTDRSLANTFINKTSSRFDLTRLVMREGMEVMGILFFYVMLAKSISCEALKTRAVALGAAGIFLFYLLTVNLTRQHIVAVAVVMVFFTVFYVHGRQKLVILALMCLAILYGSFAPALEGLRFTIALTIESILSELDAGEGTIGVRAEGIAFNMQIFADTGFFGIGNRSDRLPADDPYFYGRELHRYHSGDHGIFGVIYRFGVIGLIITLWLVLQMLKDARFVIRHGNETNKAVALGIQLFVLHGIVSMSEFFWDASSAAIYGMIFFILWRMRQDTLLHLHAAAHGIHIGRHG